MSTLVCQSPCLPQVRDCIDPKNGRPECWLERPCWKPTSQTRASNTRFFGSAPHSSTPEATFSRPPRHPILLSSQDTASLPGHPQRCLRENIASLGSRQGSTHSPAV